MTPSGIELATFRFVAQHLNHCATAVPISEGSFALLSGEEVDPAELVRYFCLIEGEAPSEM